MALMALNDHFLKHAYPSWVTGKLSDFLGVFYFPLFLAAVWCVIARKNLTQRLLFTTMILTAALMLLVKTDAQVTRFIEETFSHWLFRIRMTADPSDLISLVSLFATYGFARRYISKPTANRPAEAR